MVSTMDQIYVVIHQPGTEYPTLPTWASEAMGFRKDIAAPLPDTFVITAISSGW